MDFKEFCLYVSDHILEFLPEDHKNYRVSLHDVQRINQKESCGIVLIQPRWIEGPFLELGAHYQEYVMGKPLYEIMGGLAEEQLKREKSILPKEDAQNFLNVVNDFSEVADRIMLRAVGYSKNKEMLETVPHQVMGDIAAIYEIFVSRGENMRASVRIDDYFMNKYGITLENLHEIAVRNTMKAMPLKVKTMGKMIEEISGAPNIHGFVDDMCEVKLIVATNKQMRYGAAIAFYPDVFEQCGIDAEQCYIIPSSVHELMLLPKKEMSLNAINEVVQEMNETVIAPDEVLSDLIHEYDPVSKKLFIGGNFQKKELAEGLKHQPKEMKNTKCK